MVLVMVVMVVTTEGRGVACLYRKDPNESASLARICVKVMSRCDLLVSLEQIVSGGTGVIGISLVSKPFESRQVG